MLDERKEKILAAIVNDYVETAEPVGSRTISKKYDIGFSSATIRNEMADLEELGFIAQPHTSAGRAPTDQGYRYYVNKLMARGQHTFEEEQRLYEYIKTQPSIDEERLRFILKEIAHVTGYTTMMMTPEAEVTQPLLSLLDLIYLMPERGLMVVVTDDERVEQRLIDLPKGFTAKELSVVNSVLSHYLRGLSVQHWHRPLIEFLVDQMGSASGFVNDILEVLNDILNQRQRKQVIVEEPLHILEHPEFQDTEKIKTLLTAFADDHRVATFFKDSANKGITVRIGDENSASCLEQCGMVIAGYSVGKHVGQLAIVGPKRMKYLRCVMILEAALHGLEQVYMRIETNETRKNALSTVVANEGDWAYGHSTDLVLFE